MRLRFSSNCTRCYCTRQRVTRAPCFYGWFFKVLVWRKKKRYLKFSVVLHSLRFRQPKRTFFLSFKDNIMNNLPVVILFSLVNSQVLERYKLAHSAEQIGQDTKGGFRTQRPVRSREGENCASQENSLKGVFGFFSLNFCLCRRSNDPTNHKFSRGNVISCHGKKQGCAKRQKWSFQQWVLLHILKTESSAAATLMGGSTGFIGFSKKQNAEETEQVKGIPSLSTSHLAQNTNWRLKRSRRKIL